MALIAHWKMNDAAGQKTVVDFSGNGYDGTADVNIVSVVGKIGSAISFDGAADLVTTVDTDAFSPAGVEISMACWVRAASYASVQRLLGKGVGYTNGEWDLSIDATGFHFNLVDSTENGYEGRTTGTMAGYHGKFVHVIATYTGAGGKANIKLYVNGVRKD